MLTQTSHQSFYVIIAIIAAFAGILFGYDTGVISGAILFIRDEFQLTPQMNGLVVSAVLLGALFGAIFSGRLSDHFGRKRLLIADAIIFIVGTFVSAVTPEVTLLIIARFVVGIAIGIASYIAPLYISEISPAKHRGLLVSLNQLAITIGILVAYVVDYWFADSGAWRWMFAMGIIPAIILLIGMLFLPYSPRWVMSKGKEQLAFDILTRIRGNKSVAQKEIDEIKVSLNQQRGNWKTLFSPTIRPALIIAAGLALLQQVTGINTIIYYAPTIFQMAGFQSASSAILATLSIGVVFVVFTIIALPLIDRLGRRALLLIGLGAMTLSLISLALIFLYINGQAWAKWGAILSMIVFIMGFAIGLGPIMWLMIAEIFPLRVRGLGASLATCVNWGSNWLVALTFLTLIQYLNATSTFLIYAAVSAISMFFVYFLVPETKGVTLEQIERNLYDHKPSRWLGLSPKE